MARGKAGGKKKIRGKGKGKGKGKRKRKKKKWGNQEKKKNNYLIF
jgi:hypothetical protein